MSPKTTTPYYPVNSPSDRETLSRYQVLAHQERHTVFGGRLAQYKYFDMNDTIEAALVVAASIVRSA
jgi:UDP-galactopyranose mutase